MSEVAKNNSNLPRDDEMVLAICSDDNFALPLCVTICSAIMNLEPAEKAIIYVIDGGITAVHRDRLVWCVRRISENVRLSFLPADNLALSGLKEVAYFGTGTYLRLLIPALLPPEIQKVVFLDTDLIVRRSVGGLWNTDFGNAPMLAIQDPSLPTFGAEAGPLHTYQLHGVSPDLTYFNAGVSVINLSLWRAESIAKQIMTFLHDNADRLRWADQDGMNVVLAGRVRPLDGRWNYQYGSISKSIDPAERQRRLAESFIVHFTGPNKPWRPAVLDPERVEFLKYLIKSRWFSPLELAGFLAKYLAIHLRYRYLGPLARMILKPGRSTDVAG